MLCVDIGNSKVALGLFAPDGRMVLRESMPTHAPSLAVDVARLAADATHAIISSVVPQATDIVADAIESATGTVPLILTHRTQTGMTLDISTPETLGTDRIASSIAALDLLDGPPVAVVDFGTATTVNFVRAGKGGAPVFAGGAIMPGMALMSNALSTGTAALPAVDVTRAPELPGRDTAASILAGIAYANLGGVRRIIEEVSALHVTQYKVAITGGMMDYFRPMMARVELADALLVLKGLAIILKRNMREADA